MLPTTITTALAMSRTEERITFAERRNQRRMLGTRPVRRVGGAR